MNKFKVGERYILSGVLNSGNVIEITAVNGKHYSYKTIKGVARGSNFGFDENSMMGIGLIPITQDRYELHITCNDGKTTNAVYKVNGKIVERKQALLSPKDTFDFSIGAQEAFDRVFPKATSTQPIAPQEDKPRFKVGDRVRATALPHRGFVGTVIGVTRDDIGVEFDKNINGHECGYFGMPRGKKDHCWLLGEDELEPYTEPEQPKEPIKLYCVKDYKALLSPMFTRGKIYETDENEQIKADSGLTTYRKWNSDKMKKEFPEMFASLIPLVKRPAKVGEWVLITDAKITGDCYQKGDICKATRRNNPSDVDGIYIESPTGKTHMCCDRLDYSGKAFVYDSEYLVLENYHPEPEKEPEPVYLNMKVVCTKSTQCYHTVGMAYEIKDGFINYDGGSGAYNGKPITTLEEFNGRQPDKFIPYLGEA